MAKKKSHSTNFFPHDSNARNDEKLVRLRMRHGAAGYGVYFMILERLREERNYMSAKDYNMIAFDLRVDSSLVKSVVEDFGLFVFTDGKYFYSESFNRRMGETEETNRQRSAAGKKGNEKRWGGDKPEPKQIDTPVVPQCEKAPNDNDTYFVRFFKGSISLQTLMKNFGLRPDQMPVLKSLAKEVINEWELTNKQHNDYTDWSQHLIQVMRIKYDLRKTKKQDEQTPDSSDYTYSGGFRSKDV